jgi:hypothetical protein
MSVVKIIKKYIHITLSILAVKVAFYLPLQLKYYLTF